ncbi:MAG TPA: sulfatase-like hydrolase/transferase [Allosphingosinicella sp.]|nr:sulfatase-like hydrolase/transferase [Allosphingosinicella sp.]
MQAEIAALAESPPRARRAADVLARLTLPTVVFLTLMLELALAERKFALFGGGFGQSRAVDGVPEIAALLGALLACHSLLFYTLYRLVRRLHGRLRDSLLFHLNFVFVATAGAAALLIAKYQALAYFSDALSFQVVRNLGGGSLVQALLYSASEAGLILTAVAGAAACYVVVRLLLRRHLREPVPDRTRLAPRELVTFMLLVPLILYGANRIDDVRSGLGRFNSVYAVSLLLNEASDFDRDGYGFYSSPIDGQPFDGSRHPYALDVPNNGVDEDGFAGDLALAEAAPPAAPAPVRIAGERPHVVLVVLESTRGDVLGRRHAGVPVAPTLDAVAAAGTSAPAAYSHVGFTAGSMQTLFTGRLEPRGPRGSLFEAFAANGYRTGVFSSQAEDFGEIAATVGMRGADIFVDAATLRDERVYSLGSVSSLNLDGKVLLREFDRRLGDAAAWRRPQFLYFNLQAAHFPYSFPGMDRILPGEAIPRSEINAGNRARLEATYWNAVAYNDRLLGALVARLRRLGVWDRTLLVVTGDHGESLFEDGFLGHGHMINRRQTHVPFVLNRRVPLSGPVGLADMRGIILRAAGAGVPPEAGATPGRVFQYIGSLERPSSIGLVDGAGRWTIFSFDREALWTSAVPAWRDYRALASGAGRSEADALIREWGRQRWLARAGG